MLSLFRMLAREEGAETALMEARETHRAMVQIVGVGRLTNS